MKRTPAVLGLLVALAVVLAVTVLLATDMLWRFTAEEESAEQVVYQYPASAELVSPRREGLARYVARIHPKFPDPRQAANQLLYAEAVGGASAELTAAVIAVESRWGKLLGEGDVNLGQLTRGTETRMFGGASETWEVNVYRASVYLAGCKAAEGGAVYSAAGRYNRGPRWQSRPEAHAYARAVLRQWEQVHE